MGDPELNVDAGQRPDTTGEPGSPEGEAPSALAGEMAELAAQLKEHHARAAARERVIDNLHAEVERLRAGERSSALRPVVTDLQNLRGELLSQAASLPSEITTQFVADLLESFALSAELALERCGIHPLRPEPGQVFSPREHRAVTSVPAPERSQHGTIAAVASEGYLDTTTERVTAPARVHVYRHVENSPANDEPEGGTTDA